MSSAKQIVFLVILLRTKQVMVIDVIPTFFVAKPNSTTSPCKAAASKLIAPICFVTKQLVSS